MLVVDFIEYLVVVNTTDRFVYEPSPIGHDDVTLSPDLTELREAIAENAHEIWAKAVLTKVGRMALSATIRRSKRPTWCLTATSLNRKNLRSRNGYANAQVGEEIGI